MITIIVGVVLGCLLLGVIAAAPWLGLAILGVLLLTMCGG